MLQFVCKTQCFRDRDKLRNNDRGADYGRDMEEEEIMEWFKKGFGKDSSAHQGMTDSAMTVH